MNNTKKTVTDIKVENSGDVQQVHVYLFKCQTLLNSKYIVKGEK